MTLAECREVLKQLMITGDIGYEDYRLPGPFIRRLVLERRKNQPKSEAELVAEHEAALERREKRKSYTGSPMASVLATAIEMRHNGSTEADIMDYLDRAVASL